MMRLKILPREETVGQSRITSQNDADDEDKATNIRLKNFAR